jgi:hypothetical protein
MSAPAVKDKHMASTKCRDFDVILDHHDANLAFVYLTLSEKSLFFLREELEKK